jgi:hypothetical protein
LIENGIFHGIGPYAIYIGIENKGLFPLVYNRVGVTWQRQAISGAGWHYKTRMLN